jgi:hypothetical protein
VALVVFLVGSASGEGDGVALTVALEVVVDELGPVVGVDTEDAKGYGWFGLFYGSNAEAFTSAHKGCADGKAGGDVGHVQCV